MRHAILICLLLSFVDIGAGQETPPPLVLPTVTTPVKQVQTFALPDPLTVSTLMKALVQTRNGRYEPMQVVQATIMKGASVVSLLKQILFVDSASAKVVTDPEPGDTLQSPGVVVDHDVSAYIIASLEGIATQACYDMLMQAAASHPNPGVRGSSLIALGNSYHDRVSSDALKPNPEIVHLLLKCADDKESVLSRKKSIGEIARSGLLTWTGMDLGESIGDPPTILVGKTKTQMSIGEYREYWWSTQSSKLTWNKEDGRFTVRQ